MQPECNPSKGSEIKRHPNNNGHLSTLVDRWGGEIESKSTNFRLSQSTWERAKLIKGDPDSSTVPLMGTDSQLWAYSERAPEILKGFTEWTREGDGSKSNRSRT